jgi:HlyD family secretion protein
VSAFVRANQSLETERSQLAALNASLAATQLRSPAAGVVSGVDGSPNTSVAAGRTVVYLATSQERVVRAPVTERDVARIALGQSAMIQLASGSNDQRMSATVVGVAESEGLREAILKLNEPEPTTTFGDAVQALITIRRSDNALLVPQRAIRLVSGRRYVDVAEGSSQRRSEVELGIVNANDVEITNGLQEGQLVLVGA